MLLLAMFGTKL